MKRLALVILLCAWAGVTFAAQMGSTPTTSTGGQVNSQSNPNIGVGGDPKSIDPARSVYISGKVVMQDGSPVPQNVAIQRVCSGAAKAVAYTDAKGHFNFRWGDGATVISDASDAGSGSSSNSSAGGFGSSQSAGGGNPLASDPFGNRMMNCDIRANVAGYSSNTISLFNRAATDGSDIGVIILRRIAGIEGSSISVTSMMASKDAKKAYERGLQATLKNKPADAAKEFEKAVAAYSGYAEAWLNLGKVRLQMKSIDPGRAALLRAIEADPKLVPPYLELGLLFAGEANWERSGEFLDKAVKLDPVDFPQAWYADAVAHYNLKNYDAAEKSAREAVKLDPRHANPRAGYLLGLVLAEKHNYAGAVAELTAYLQQVPDAPDVAQVKEQLKQIEKLNTTSQASRQ
jgi:tetratricopeptide (TPR) repeat protein